MKKLNLFLVAAVTFISFTACNNNHPDKENPDKMVSSNSDTTSEASRDSIAKGTVVTPETATPTTNP